MHQNQIHTANFEVFLWNISLTADLLFIKSVLTSNYTNLLRYCKKISPQTFFLYVVKDIFFKPDPQMLL